MKIELPQISPGSWENHDGLIYSPGDNDAGESILIADCEAGTGNADTKTICAVPELLAALAEIAEWLLPDVESDAMAYGADTRVKQIRHYQEKAKSALLKAGCTITE